MPIYEYQCESCGAVTDIKHGFKETTSDSCPKCGGNLKRLFNAASIVFKGSGFYVNDSRKSSDAKAESSSKGDTGSSKSEGGSGTSDGGKSEGTKSDGGKTSGGGKSDAAA
jgi:putative FmdB family regulatory protein